MVVHRKNTIVEPSTTSRVTTTAATYIGDTKKALNLRFKEHTNLDKPTGVGDHCRATGHSVSTKNPKVLTQESNWHKRKVKVAIYIKQRLPTMNRGQG